MSDPSLVADRYRLDELIGSGPLGQVWRGYDTRADWVVAVKTLGARAAGAATREKLRQHAQAVAKVIHPNVAMVLDVGEHDGAPFLVMEYLTGMSLGEELAAGGPMKIMDVCDLVGQAAAGLDAAHRAGVVHGEIDPDSFRRAGSGVLKVVGFGLDGQGSDDARYTPPEGWGRPSGDLYALGCVCYELLCARRPFEPAAPGTDPGAVPGAVPGPAGGGTAGAGGAAAGEQTGGLAAIGFGPSGTAESPRPDAIGSGGPASPASGGGAGAGAAGSRSGPVPPSAYRADVPPELDRLVLAMIAEDPARRPAGGEAVRRALTAIARPRANPDAMPATGASPRDPGLTAAPHGGVPGATGPGGMGTGMGPMGMGPTGAGPTGVWPGGGARAGDTAVYQAGDLEPDSEQGANRKLILQLGAAVAVIVVVTVGMVMWAGSRERPVAGATPTPELAIPSATPTEEPTPTPEPSTPTPTRDLSSDVVSTLGPDDPPASLRETVPPKATLGPQAPPGGWDNWLRRFDEAVRYQESGGGINPDVAAKAHEKIRKATEKLREGKTSAAVGQVADLYRELRQAQQKGDLHPLGPLPDFLDDWRIQP
ncbi:MAG TPA: serine/threonine-protein kinase [Nonomuraea sp.]|nr:serine/threonine-protein kinase [Nonomuraea sp.]